LRRKASDRLNVLDDRTHRRLEHRVKGIAFPCQAAALDLAGDRGLVLCGLGLLLRRGDLAVRGFDGGPNSPDTGGQR